MSALRMCLMLLSLSISNLLIYIKNNNKKKKLSNRRFRMFEENIRQKKNPVTISVPILRPLNLKHNFNIYRRRREILPNFWRN